MHRRKRRKKWRKNKESREGGKASKGYGPLNTSKRRYSLGPFRISFASLFYYLFLFSPFLVPSLFGSGLTDFFAKRDDERKSALTKRTRASPTRNSAQRQETSKCRSQIVTNREKSRRSGPRDGCGNK